LTYGFVALTLFVAAGAVGLVRVAARAAGASDDAVRSLTRRAAAVLALHLAATALLAWAGALWFGRVPPTMALLILATLAASIWCARSRFGRMLADATPLELLVGFQAFRLPLEVVMHRAAVEGVMPPQMSYSGLNFDIVTGASAMVVALLLPRLPSARARVAVAGVWNVVGSLLLLNVLTIAVLSAPTPLRTFHNEPANVWITHAPFVWLPELLVPFALIGHLMIFRRLRGGLRGDHE